MNGKWGKRSGTHLFDFTLSVTLALETDWLKFFTLCHRDFESGWAGSPSRRGPLSFQDPASSLEGPSCIQRAYMKSSQVHDTWGGGASGRRRGGSRRVVN